jgi:xanthine dehydrogenase accessory factor
MMLPQELREMHILAERLIAAEVPGVLATLFWAEGSTYRRLGSMMVCGLSADMKCGGVSGGCLEDYIIRRGHELLRSRSSAMLSFSSDPLEQHDDAPKLGCGGKVEVLIERLTAEHLPVLQAMANAASSDQPTTWPVVIEEDDSQVLHVARPRNLNSTLSAASEAALASARSVTCQLDRGRRGLLQYIAPLRRLVVFGAGPDVIPLVTMAKLCGWHVTVADRRRRMAFPERFPGADQVLAAEWPDLCQAIRWTPHTAAVVITHSYDDDLQLVPLLAEICPPYVGLLGPTQRRDRLLRELARETEFPAQFLDSLHAPIGLPLGDRSSAGIAVAILSEVLQHFSQSFSPPKLSALNPFAPAMSYA